MHSLRISQVRSCFWEKIPETPETRAFMKGWYYEVAEDADYNGGKHDHEKPFYFIEVRIPGGRLTTLDRLGIMRDFTKLVMIAEESDMSPENTLRVWVTIVDIERDNWGNRLGRCTNERLRNDDVSLRKPERA